MELVSFADLVIVRWGQPVLDGPAVRNDLLSPAVSGTVSLHQEPHLSGELGGLKKVARAQIGLLKFRR